MRSFIVASIIAISTSSFAQSPCEKESALWMESINNVDDLRVSYIENPVIITSNLTLLDENPGLTDYFEEISDRLKDSEISTIECINASRDINYEINRIQKSKMES